MLGFESCKLGIADSELSLQDLGVVFAEHRRWARPVPMRAGRHAHRPRRVLVQADDRMLDRFEEATRAQLRVVDATFES